MTGTTDYQLKGLIVSDQSIESQIQAKGLMAPRVTPDDLQANIVSEHYFTAAQGVNGADIEALRNKDRSATLTIEPMIQDPCVPKTGLGPLTLLTFCVLVLRNGFTVTGKSACASPENFDAEIGKKIAHEDAIQQMWPLMGYALKERLFQASLIPCEKGVVLGVQIIEGDKPAFHPHQQRVIDEKRELDEKLSKLGDFIEGNAIFATLPVSEQMDLKSQRVVMQTYSCILSDRIARFGSAT
jgi:hypothetical protein